MESSNVGIQFREIHKNGWLRRVDAMEKEAGRSWAVFCVHDDVEPRLEGYVDQKQAASHTFVWNTSLQNVMHVSPTLCASEQQDFEFCINFDDQRALRLAAPTYQEMNDWVQAISRKLTDMKILSPKENLYSKGPGIDRLATRDPTSPLPLPPRPTPPLNRPPIPTPSTNSESRAVQSSRPQAAEPIPIPSSAHVNRPEIAAGTNRVQRSETVPNFFTFDNIPDDRSRPVVARSISNGRSDRNSENVAQTDNDNSSYESLFLASSYSPTRPDRNAPTNDPNIPDNSHYAALREYRSQATSIQPRSSRTRGDREENGRQLTLREQQVLQLKREMSHMAGVRLKMRRRDCKDDIAMVDVFGAVWVAGWKHREHPTLYNVLHIGDKVLSLAGTPVYDVTAARDILKSCTTPYVEMIVRRLPLGRAMTLARGMERDGDSEGFGLELNGNEVTGVGSTALAVGLPPLAPAADPSIPPGTLVSWTLTEVNGRPLNILGQGGGARERLGAVGLDISVVVQPTDLVSSLQKRLRTIRGYKNYVLH